MLPGVNRVVREECRQRIVLGVKCGGLIALRNSAILAGEAADTLVRSGGRLITEFPEFCG